MEDLDAKVEVEMNAYLMADDALELAKEDVRNFAKELCAGLGIDEAKAEKIAEDEVNIFPYCDINDADDEQLSCMLNVDDVKKFLLGNVCKVLGLCYHSYQWITPEFGFSWKEYVEDDIKVNLGLMDVQDACWA